MARLPRFDLPGVPQHVVQRGNNRLPCFLDDLDRQRYLQCLHHALGRFGCRLHAHVLMSNHVHLLLTPAAVGQVAALMQSLGRRYVRYINDRHHRTGTLWEGRYKACPVDRDSYLLHCYRYIALNPVHARMVDEPDGYRWQASVPMRAEGPDPLVTPHPMILALGRDTQSRQTA